jgi:hypothetical protein
MFQITASSVHGVKPYVENWMRRLLKISKINYFYIICMFGNAEFCVTRAEQKSIIIQQQFKRNIAL